MVESVTRLIWPASNIVLECQVIWTPICMLMPVSALGGSALYAMKRPWTKLESKNSFWLMAMLSLQTVLIIPNGYFVQHAESLSTLNVLLHRQNIRLNSKDGPLYAHLMSAKGKKIKRVTPHSQTRSTNRVGSPSGSIFPDFLSFTERWQSKNSRRKARGERSCRHQNRRKTPCPIRAREIRPGRSQTWTRQRNFGRPTRLKPRKISCPWGP